MDETVPGAQKRMKQVAERLLDRLVDGEGKSPDPGAVEKVVEDAAHEFDDAVVQDFVPLLVENQASATLRERGLHADPAKNDIPDEGAVHDSHQDRGRGDSPADIPMPPR
jgi:hypothetical protein